MEKERIFFNIYERMLNKITFWNLITLTIILLVSFFGVYFINYPMIIDIWEVIYILEWEKMFFLFLGMVILSLIFALFPLKKMSYGNKFQKILLVLNVLILLYTFCYTISTFAKNKSELRKIENEYIEQAKKDVKNDKVTFKFAGGLPVPEYDKNTYDKIDSIRKKYGIIYFNTGCIVDYKAIEAQKKYEIIVKPYLEKRNGKNWEAKMNDEIQKVKSDYKKDR